MSPTRGPVASILQPNASSMSAFHHVTSRHSPPHVRKSALTKPARSAPGTSHRVASKPSKHRRQISRAEKAREDDDKKEEEAEEDGDYLINEQDCHMATTFLQYCATCEKQIFVPDASVLYCSEQCRRIDALPPADAPHRLLAQSFPSKVYDPHSNRPDPFNLSLPRHVPSLQPTPPSHKTARIPPEEHDGTLDLDPTEWKPAESLDHDHDHDTGYNRVPRPSVHARERSDALVYLSKFHRARGCSSASKHQQASSRGPPSLSHTSTTTASSLSSSGRSSLSGTPYSLVSPPPVSVPTTSITKAMSDTSDQVATLSLASPDSLSYQKKTVIPGSTSATGSLKRLLGGVSREQSL